MSGMDLLPIPEKWLFQWYVKLVLKIFPDNMHLPSTTNSR